VGPDPAYAPAAGERQPLPQNFAVAPYYEMALDQAHPVRESMLAELLLLDALFAGEQA
jgi:uncharacterized protein YqcC (DUF446 family)